MSLPFSASGTAFDWISVRVLKWEASSPEAVISDKGRSEKSFISAFGSWVWSDLVIDANARGLTSSWTAFCSFSWSSTSRFLLSDLASLFCRPEGLDFRPTAGGGIIHNSWLSVAEINWQKLILLLGADKVGASGRLLATNPPILQELR